MTHRPHQLACFALLGAFALACSDDAGNAADESAAASDTCDETRRPIVFVHGFFASGDSFSNHVQRFASNGYCEERIFAFNWDTSSMQGLGAGNVETAVPLLDAFVDEALAKTGAEQIDLGGHSQGGQLGMAYLSAPERAAKVAHYAHFGSFALPDGPPGGVPTINIWSPADAQAANGGGFPGVPDVELGDQDHFQMATSPESFLATFEHFNDGESPETTEIVAEDTIEVSGLAVGFGDNLPSPGGTIDVYAIDGETAERRSETPVATFTGDGAGIWGPFTAEPDTYYEIHATSAIGQIHVYREPFVRSHPLVYVRSMPAQGSLTFTMLNSYQMTPDAFDDAEARLTFNTSGQSVRFGRDTLTVDGENVATAEIAEPSNTTLAVFFNDGNGNGQSDLVPSGGLPIQLPFLTGFDQVFPSDPARAIPVVFNGRTINVRNWKSKSEGASVVVFD